MADEHPLDPGEDLVFRRGKLRKRDDPAIDLFREALDHLEDAGRVKGIVIELGRLYDPVSNGAILSPATGRRVVEGLEAGRVEEARQLLEEALRTYTRRPTPDGPSVGENPGH
jgi:hypothetical protein